MEEMQWKNKAHRGVLMVGVLAAAALLAACGGGGGSAEEPPPSGGLEPLDTLTAKTQQGVVSGVQTGNVVAFRGVPYAAPPVGDLRWKPPAEALVRTSTYDASTAKPACTAQEDCLFLNVFKPADAKRGEKLPVFMWMHGGALQSGNGAFWDGTALVNENRMIVVPINYRLAGAGLFAHPAITAENNGAAANYAFLDQMAAMKWIKANIAEFGGDPDNITIGGESAGAVSTTVHLASPKSAGLFQKALVISNGVIRQNTPLATAETQGQADAVRWGCPGTDAAAAACLRALPFSTIRPATAYSRGSWSPVIDNNVLNESTAVAFAAGRFNRVPMLIGAMRNERSLGAKSFSAAPLTAANYAARAVTTMPFVTEADILTHYPASNWPTPTHAYNEAVGDYGWFCQTMLDAQSFKTHNPTSWGFEFAQQEQAQTIPDAAKAQYPGAELPFYGPWGNFHASSNPYWFGQFADEDKKTSNLELSAAMRKYLSNLARTGNPNGTGLPNWAPMADIGGKALVFRTPIQTEVDVMTPHRCDFWKDKPLTDKTFG